MLSSFPPDVDVPLPLEDELEPVVWGGAALGFALLAAGSPVTDPLPLGLPCAQTLEMPTRTKTVAMNTFKLPPSHGGPAVIGGNAINNLRDRCWFLSRYR